MKQYKFIPVPEKYFGVIKFSGFTGDETVAEKTAYLKSWVAKEKFNSHGYAKACSL
jgi:hypothetical protein